VQLEIISFLQEIPSAIFFYGAGCSSIENKKLIEVALREINPKAKIEVEHDLLAVARALCQNEVGIAVILGTGSNSCLYNGSHIVKNTPSLGYILGDEGSGSYIGKQFIADIWYDRVPQDLKDLFIKEFPFDLNYYLNKIYKEPHANAFLASFCKWLSDHKNNKYVNDLLKNSFEQFLEKQIKPYGVQLTRKIHCIGSIAYYFKNEWKDVILEHGYELGNMEQNPIYGLIQYHSSWKE
jgi:glucosamine kinase